MIYDHIRISHNDDLPGHRREKRLLFLLGYLSALAPFYKDTKELMNNIEAVHDHKGTLSITWKNKPLDSEKRLITRGWDACGEIGIIHFTSKNGKEIEI